MSYGNGYGNRQGASGYRGNTGGGGNRQFTPRTQAQGQGQAQRKDNTGSMRRNTEKQNDKQPDYKGSVLVAGRLYFISGWDNGDYYKLARSSPFLSILEYFPDARVIYDGPTRPETIKALEEAKTERFRQARRSMLPMRGDNPSG